MSKTLKSKWAERLFAAYSDNLFRRKFSSFRVAGFEYLSRRNAHLPLLILANHSSWWDGLVGFRLSRAAGHDAHFLMELKNLRQYPFFRRLGAVPVDLESSANARSDLDRAAGVLNSPNRCLWIFPQGRIEPNNVENLAVRGGAARVVELAGGCETICAAISYQFLGEFLPHVFVKIGRPAIAAVDDPASRKQLRAEFIERLNGVRNDLLDDLARNSLDDYRPL